MNNSILFCILHGQVAKERYHNIIDTWGSEIDYLFYGDYEDLGKNIIKVSNRTDYSSNEEKHVNIIKRLAVNLTHQWYFFCDDDTFVNTHKLIHLLPTFDINKVHGTHITGCWPHDKSLEYCSGGAGYLLHRDVLRHLATNIKVLKTDFADVTLGLHMRDLGVVAEHHPYFKSQPPEFFGIEASDYYQYISFHYIKSISQMRDIYLRVKNDQINL